ncbi:hypothetical protein CKM354_001112500 [Cercospora kikuchii]|uniref:Heterokaryon incompatibility domain-containing protein n=1 Tax=Cercospora kikuchii TaxID=84275 RepID=A0A9P3CWH4_9PEZI|nr:uncharacterized protein CKM354_001112500 [Cercospora kikuchii]GIZ48050.1 hypothetical protein CKM354_001112500 [Cercospora kikuchii]
MDTAPPPPGGANLYRPLSVELRQIRLLTILPGSFDDGVRCTLDVVSLLDSCSYETISYCWGDASLQSSITVNCGNINVPYSAMAAVRRVRSRDRARVVWIDAICINQRDNVEKGTQVALMSTIYSNGMHNLVWLGDDDVGHASAVLDYLQSKKIQVQQAFKDREEFEEKLSQGDLGKFFRTELDHYLLRELYDLPWFRRLWVLQEAALSRDSTCHWGSFQVALDQLFLVSKMLYLAGGQISIGLHTASLMYRECGVQHSGTSSRSFFRIANRCYGFVATDLRDHVFAPLALFLVQQPPDYVMSPLLAPDYTKTTHEVFRDATRYALEDATESEDLLLRIQHFSQQDLDNSLASWTFQFDRDIACQYQGQTACRLDRSGFSAGVKDKRDADRLKMLKHPVPDPNVITLHVAVLGSVSETSIELDVQQLNKTATLRHIVHSVHAMTQFRHEVTALVLVTERMDSHAGHYTDVAQRLKEYHLFFTSLDTDSEELPVSMMYSPIFITVAFRRRYFRTAAGLVGCGPGIMKKGDVIVVPENASLPCVLSPVGEQYLLLGVAYVHGIMHGEVFNMDAEWKWVEIR